MELEQQEKIIVLDFGGQYNQLIARRVRDEGVYAEVYASDIDLDKLKAMQPKGLIFTGGATIDNHVSPRKTSMHHG